MRGLSGGRKLLKKLVMSRTLMRSSEKYRRGKRFVKDVGDQKAGVAGGRIA